MDTEKLESQTIDFIRFPLIVLVVFIHSYNSSEIVQGVEYGAEGNFFIYDNIRFLISQIFARVAVPMFFFTSGFLYFYKVKKWDIDTYKTKSKKRVRSLVVPYLFWNSLAILIYFILQSVAGSLHSGETTLIKDYTFWDFVAAYGVYGDYKIILYPILYPFWFIRDLIIIVALTPIVHFLIKYLKIPIIALFLINWIFSFVTFPVLSDTCILFFSLGAYFSINKINLYECFNRFWKPSFIVYSLLVVIALVTKEYDYNVYIRKIGMLFGIVFFFNLIAINLRKGKLHATIFLSSASFFVFAMHEPWLRFFRKALFAIFKPESEVSLILLYFIPAISIICASLICYKILSRFTPKLLAFVTGGREHKA